MSTDKLIYEFAKNAAEKIVIQFREFKGKKLIDLRVFYLSNDGSWRPTPKGISLRRELLLELRDAVDKASEEYEKELPGQADKGEDSGQTGQKDSGACMNGGARGPDHDARAGTSREGHGGEDGDE